MYTDAPSGKHSSGASHRGTADATGRQASDKPTWWIVVFSMRPMAGTGPKDNRMPKTLKKKSAVNHNQLHKCPTGIKGFDQITEGGLPKNRTTLFCGSTGTGKTLLGIDFLINGAINYNEPGLFMSFEETQDEIYKVVSSLNMDLQGLVERGHVFINFILCLFE